MSRFEQLVSIRVEAFAGNRPKHLAPASPTGHATEGA
jgi:hypothetical protein